MCAAALRSSWHRRAARSRARTRCSVMAAGVPVLASQLGGLPGLAGADASLPPGDAAAWTVVAHQAVERPQERRRRGDAARARAWERAAPERVHAALMGVYERAGANLDAPLLRT